MEIDHSTPGIESVTNDARYEDLCQLIYHSYAAHELLCLYAEISLLCCKQGANVLHTLTSFDIYVANITDKGTPPYENSSDMPLFHSKIKALALKIREAAQVGRILISAHRVGMV